MQSRYRYVLIAGIIVIVYLFYAIASYKFYQFQTDNFVEALLSQNQQITARNTQKENFERYIHTDAYRTQVAKTTHNKKLPGEELINVVSQEIMDSNKRSDELYTTVERQKDAITDGMSNPERWMYFIRTGIPRE